MNKFASILIFLSITILAGVAFTFINPVKKLEDYNDKIRMNDLQKISLALERYHADYGRYPDQNEQRYTIVVPDGEIAWGASWDPYMEILPKDPNGKRTYVYVSNNTDGYQSFRLYASLQDPAAEKRSCSVSGKCPNVPEGASCGQNAPCNFGVTSNNTSQ